MAQARVGCGHTGGLGCMPDCGVGSCWAAFKIADSEDEFFLVEFDESPRRCRRSKRTGGWGTTRRWSRLAPSELETRYSLARLLRRVCESSFTPWGESFGRLMASVS